MARAKSRAERIREKAKQGASTKAAEQFANQVESRGRDYLALPENVDIASFKARSEYYIDVVAYEPGPQDPRVKNGQVDPKEDLVGFLRFAIHAKLGPMEVSRICLNETFGVPCEGCKEVAAMKKEGADFKTEIKPLLPKPRELYQCVITEGTTDEVPEKASVLETSWHLFGKKIKPLVKGRPIPGQKGKRRYLDYITPLEDGQTISIEAVEKDTGNFSFIDLAGHKLLDRDYAIPDKILDNALDLVELLAIDRKADGTFDFDSYNKKMREDLDGGVSSDKGKSEEGTTKKPSRREEAEAKEKEEFLECPIGATIGDDYDGYEECDDCEIKAQCKELSGAEDEPEETTEDEVEEVPFEEDEVEAEEPPELEETEEVVEEEQEETEESSDNPECPVEGGTIGKDFHEYDDCEECPVWEDCFKLSTQESGEKVNKNENGSKKAEDKPKPEPKGQPKGKAKGTITRRRRG